MTENIRNFIVHWIKEYAQENGIKTLTVGISGGIDSALTSTLCALTGINTIVVSMPIHQKKAELHNAEKHADWLVNLYPNVQKELIDLTILFEEYKKTIPTKFHSQLNLANARARIRMTTLYQIAGSQNGLVVGTGNKIEDFGIGFFTKYGDGGVDISPIADLTKSEVKNLAQYCKIHRDIINAPPTDGLWEDGRTDEDQIGATYKELEWAMNYCNDTKITKRQMKVLKIYNKLNEKNKHKTEPIPVCYIPKHIKN
jgi:NAD+ synthase